MSFIWPCVGIVLSDRFGQGVNFISTADWRWTWPVVVCAGRGGNTWSAEELKYTPWVHGLWGVITPRRWATETAKLKLLSPVGTGDYGLLHREKTCGALSLNCTYWVPIHGCRYFTDVILMVTSLGQDYLNDILYL